MAGVVSVVFSHPEYIYGSCILFVLYLNLVVVNLLHVKCEAQFEQMH